MPRRIAGSTINIDTAIENISCYASQNTFDNFKIRDAGLSKPRLHLHTLDESVQMLKKSLAIRPETMRSPMTPKEPKHSIGFGYNYGDIQTPREVATLWDPKISSESVTISDLTSIV